MFGLKLGFAADVGPHCGVRSLRGEHELARAVAAAQRARRLDETRGAAPPSCRDRSHLLLGTAEAAEALGRIGRHRKRVARQRHRGHRRRLSGVREAADEGLPRCQRALCECLARLQRARRQLIRRVEGALGELPAEIEGRSTSAQGDSIQRRSIGCNKWGNQGAITCSPVASVPVASCSATPSGFCASVFAALAALVPPFLAACMAAVALGAHRRLASGAQW